MQFLYFIPLNPTFTSNVTLLKSFAPDGQDVGMEAGKGYFYETDRRLTPEEAEQAGAILHTQPHTTPPKRRQPRKYIPKYRPLIIKELAEHIHAAP